MKRKGNPNHWHPCSRGTDAALTILGSIGTAVWILGASLILQAL